ncbi:MAG: ABC-F family ATP-binding cassette domain-containing protein [Flavobacteriales bacterium]|nr:ABC-F family ATP-binding cassette domain-containing protein [Flavobacteriales bacterium]MCB9190917.1 ABC-F family ATP-binding cassette domain-containing protein [Flavobacteriales bacterium]
MISLNQVSVQFNGNFLFKEISFLVNPKDRIGLVGKNGAGKSTLLKVLSGKLEPESGTVSQPSGCTIGYLSQDIKPKLGKTVFNETYSALEELQGLEHKVNDYTKQLETRTDYESEEYMQIIQDLHVANERFSMLGGHTADAEVEKVLMGLGFLRSDLNRDLGEFSGGWQMRVELAKILVQRPDVLLLDEPTNHLDILSIQWLETFLHEHNGSVILVSHDRAFLDNVTNRTIEITLGRINDYRVPYSKYVEQRKERRELQLAAYENQQKFIAETEKFIERFRYKATKATQVQSRIKALEKIDRIEVEQEDNSVMRLRFPPAPRAGKVVCLSEGVGKKYGDLEVLKNVDLMLDRGEKVAFVGKNGEGKTTFAKIIVGDLDYTGKCELGHNVTLGYYAQDQAESLDSKKTVFETLDDVARGDIRTKLRDILGAFLFSGEDIDKKVSVLSGGERARLALAKLLLEPVNLLVLDEPTNHLDMQSKDVLKQALIKYDGAMVIVSHDRSFLKGLTDKVYEFKDQGVRQHIGDVYEFLAKAKMENLEELGFNARKETAVVPEKNASNKDDYKARKEREKLLRVAKNKASKLEGEIEKLEAEIAALDELMLDAAAFKKAQEERDVFKEYQQKQNVLDGKMVEWEQAVEEVEKLDNQ